ncbi:MAG TPA: glycosyl transferase, partial [Xanthobacteraceae bacterium]
VPAWLVFEIIATKLPHYVLPLYPAIAILIAGVVDHHGLSRRPWLVRGTVWWFLIVAIMAALTVAAHAVLGQRLGVLAWPFAAGAVIFALGAWWLFEVDGAEHALLRAAAAAVLISVAVFAATVPRLPSLFPSAAIARYLRGAGCAPVSAAAGYHEPSLVFLAGTATVLTDGPGAADFLYSGGCRFAAVERSQERAFVQRAEALGLRYARGLRIEGVNIGVGRKVSIAVFRAERAP